MTKDETSSPTVSLESIIYTSIIDAVEGRKQAVIDIPGAFLQTKMKGHHDEDVHVRFEGKMAQSILVYTASIWLLKMGRK